MQQYLSFIFMFLMLVLAIFSINKIYRPYHMARKSVDEIIIKLKEISQFDNLDRFLEFDKWLVSKQSEDFYFLYVIPSWKNFFNKYKQNQQNGLIFTPDVYDFFLEEEFLRKFGKRKLAETVPGLFLAIGIIGTFTGIALGVSGLKATGDASTMKNGINILLEGMKVKFLSSIIGILLSGVYQFFDKLIYYPNLLNDFTNLRSALDETFPTQEESIVLHQMLLNQKEQMSDFQTFMTEMLIPTMVSGFTESIQNSLVPHLDETKTMMNTMIENTSASQMDTMKQMTDQFVTSLSEMTGDHMRDLGDALKSTVEWQQKVHREMTVLVESMQNSAKEQSILIDKSTTLTERINSYIEQVIDYQSQMESTISQLNDANEKNSNLQSILTELISSMTDERKIFDNQFKQHLELLDDSMISLSGHTESQVSLNDRLLKNLTRFNELTDKQMNVSEYLTEQIELSNESTSKINLTLAHFEKNGELIVAIQNELNASLQMLLNERKIVDQVYSDVSTNLIAQLRDMDQRIDTLNNLWKSSSDVLNSVGKQLSTSMELFTSEMHKGLEYTFSQFDEELGNSVKYLSMAVDSIHEGVIELPPTLEKLKNTINSINKLNLTTNSK
ncbi:hypothetical protein [Bacillus sp. UNCCL81]|uniref:hypothetical protein n=1 Tax=Bacillus sp. UNCCL81 TaxID=1502755 RepID=UPI0008E5386D|nr:hypothetical protein [Bacillus sp. UNCCL81]SFC95298.1 hypothetical protein SAMN02799633_02121 [Bacillus sp. UNCCL81]